MKKLLIIWKIVRKLYAQAKANPTRAAKFEAAIEKVTSAKTNAEFAKAFTSVGFAAKELYSAPKKPRVKAKPKTKTPTD
jgi:crotonobetainyl-CoA:carnitine CoA-transferase CaiB-like acyl-CoA transferase